MAHPSILYATDGGAGTKTGLSLANAAEIDPGGAPNDIWTLVNTDVPAVGDTTVKLCADSDPVTTANAAINQDGTTSDTFILQGRDAADTADTNVILDANGGAFVGLTLTAADYWRFKNIGVTGTGGANDGIVITANADRCVFYRCRSTSNGGRGFENSGAGTSHSTFLECYAASNGAEGFYYCYYVERCVAFDNGGNGGFDIIHHMGVDCISYGNDDWGFIFAPNLARCTAYGNGTDGFYSRAAYAGLWTNLISEGNTGTAFDGPNSGRQMIVDCASYNNTGGRLGQPNFQEDVGAITLSASPFIDASNGDFRLNNIAGGGDFSRHVGWTAPVLGETSYPDCGALQAIPYILRHPGTSGGARG